MLDPKTHISFERRGAEIRAVSNNMHELKSKEELVSSSNRRLKYLFFVKCKTYLHPRPDQYRTSYVKRDPRILVFRVPISIISAIKH
jgi:hypothetical protein